MTDKPQARQNILPTDVDAQGGVTLWDHGPQELKPVLTDTSERTAALKEANDRTIAQWKQKYGGIPQPVRMHQGDAAHSMMIEPGRYSMEPDGIDEGEVEKLVAEMKAKREAAVNAPQNALDRKAAISAIMSDRRSAASAAAVGATATEAAPEPFPGPPLPDEPATETHS